MQDHAIPSETWRPIPGWEGLYSVSDAGRVMSHHRKRDHILSAGRTNYGHLIVCLVRSKAFHKMEKVHRLVLLAFAGRPPEGATVCRHLDGNPANNRVSNLAWGTPTENAADALAHGTRCRGEKVGTAKINATQAAEIRAHLEAGRSANSLGKAYGLCTAAIIKIRDRKTWAHV